MAWEGNMSNTNNDRKIFILGLDGATFDIIDPMIAKGQLPQIDKLIKEAVRANLKSTVIHNSPPAWTSFATGKNPGKHGILGFTSMDPHSYKLNLVYGSHNTEKAMWEIAGDVNKKVIVVNIPMTYPPSAVNGILISGLDAPSTEVDFTYPKEVKREILTVSPNYKINLHLGGYLTTDKKRIEALDIIKETTEAMVKVLIHLMTSYPWDLFVVRFNSPDNVQHQYWSFMDENHPEHKPDSPIVLKNAIHSVYQQLDAVTKTILKHISLDDTSLMVMSDHGGGPRLGKSIFVNEWLRDLGYLSKIGDHQTGWRRHSKLILDRARHFIKQSVLGFLLKTLPPDLKAKLMKLIPFAAGVTATFLRFSGIDWKRTKVFAAEMEGLRVNLQGKYPDGIVKQEAYNELCSRVIEEAEKLIDPETGRRIFRFAKRAGDVFSGDHVGNFPDIILKTSDEYYISPKFFRGKKPNGSYLMKDAHWRKISGSHRPYGIFIMKGPDCQAGKDLGVVDIVDLCPTALFQLGIPIPDDCDGVVINEAFKAEFLASNPIRYSEANKSGAQDLKDVYSAAEKAELKDSLKALGYLDD
jgi:predicted AlkP superfamily phosphohydrolase/phosphomutase